MRVSEDVNPARSESYIAAQILQTLQDGAGGGYTLPVASAATLGGVKIGSGVSVAPDGTISVSSSGSVSSVSNSDGSLTISPTTGAVTASVNAAHANTWSATQTFSNTTSALNIPGNPGYLTFTGTGTAKGYTLSNGSWISTAVPYFRPTDTNAPGVLDVLSNGTGADSWIDIGSDFTHDMTNGEYIMVRKVYNGNGEIDVKGLGTGVGRSLVLNNTAFPGVGANGGVPSIGFNASPPTGVQYYGEYDQNAGTQWVVANSNTGSSANASMQVWNSTSDMLHYLKMMVLSTGWSSSGAYTANGGVIALGDNCNGNLAILTKNASSSIQFYQGGTSSGNLQMSVSSSGVNFSSGVAQWSLAHSYSSLSTPGYPVPGFRPTTSNSRMAIDIWPNGSPTDANYGLAWIDICGADQFGISGTPVTPGLHLACGANYAIVGAIGFGGATNPALYFRTGTAPGNTYMQITPSGQVAIDSTGGGAYDSTNADALFIKSSTAYTGEAGGIVIGSGAGNAELCMGADTTNQVAYLQSYSRVTTAGGKPLAVQANAGRLLIGGITDDGSTLLQVNNGNLAIKTAGYGLRVKEGTNAKQGRATLVGGAVDVSNTSVNSTSIIVLGHVTPGGVTGAVYVSSVIAGTGFTITSTSNSDTSVVGYEIFEQA